MSIAPNHFAELAPPFSKYINPEPLNRIGDNHEAEANFFVAAHQYISDFGAGELA